MRLSRNFTLSEFSCKCTNCTTQPDDISVYLIHQLQKLRDSLGLPIHIASGYRCEAHNMAIGGANGSKHMRGTAVDISTKNLSGQDKHRLITLAFRAGTFRGVGIGGGKLHLDVDPSREQPTFWFY